nr:DNA cytosine methyltransferase [Lysinibacillus sp. BF-4]
MKKLIIKEARKQENDELQTRDIACTQAALTNDYKIRRLTPKECWRLQGFFDKHFEKASLVNSDTQLYKQAGNSVSVPVIYAIAKKLS